MPIFYIKKIISTDSLSICLFEYFIRAGYICLLFILIASFTFYSSGTSAGIENEPPLTAHSHYKNITTHGGLAWTSDNVLGKNVLIINSYHSEDKKTALLMRGLIDAFNKSGEPIRLFVEYMDMKRFPSNFHEDNLGRVFKYKYANKRFDIIIVSGNEALDFLLKEKSEIFHSTPAIFTCVNYNELTGIRDYSDITGVIEYDDAVSTLDIALQLHPKIKTILILSPGGRNKQILSEISNKFHDRAKLLIWNDLYNSDIEQKIETLGTDIIILPVSEPRTKAGSNVSYADFVERLSKISKAPVYSIWDTALGSGTIGGKLVSGYAQGESAANLANEVMHGRDINTIPVVKDSTHRYMFDYKQMKLFGINENDLPKDSIIINKPFSIYETYHHQINLAIILLILQSGIICLLVIINNKRKKAEKGLKAINDELEQRVTIRTEQISQANQKLQKEIEERKQIELALRTSEEKFFKAFHSCPDAITITNLGTNTLIEVNEVFEKMCGYPRSEIIGKSSIELDLWVDPADRLRILDKINKYGNCRDIEVMMHSRTGHIYYISLSADIINIANNKYMLSIARDITAQKNANAELRRYEKIVSSTKDFMSYVDHNYYYRAVNQTYLDAFQLTHGDIIGQTVEDIHGKERFESVIKPKFDRCLQGETINDQHWLKIPDKEIYIDVLYSPYIEDNIVTGVVVTARDITQTHELSEMLAYQASHDSLTGLINRREFELRLQRVLATIKTTKNQYVLCYMDLDQFKVINDNCGHAAGDELLQRLGKILKKNIRQRDTLARLGGDEFAAIIENCSLTQAHKIIKKILSAIESFRFVWNNKTYGIGVSIGLVPITRSSGTINELLKQADAACYVAKNEGRNRVHTYQRDDARLAQHHFEMQGVLHVQEALDEDRFQLYKQQIIQINNIDAIYGEHYEILVRMEKDGEILSPKIFLPAAEQYGLSLKIDSCVIEKTFTWLTENPERQDGLALCSINLSGYSLVTDGLFENIINLTNLLNINPNKICFEITETAAIANYDKASKFIRELRNLGFQFALDDFGSGFSSFAYLKNLQVDYLKIDGMFIQDILKDPMALSMVKAINEIGHIAGIKTIAEFVENDHTLKKLKQLNIDYVQGYAIGQPQPIDELFDRPGTTRKQKKYIHSNGSRLKH